MGDEAERALAARAQRDKHERYGQMLSDRAGVIRLTPERVSERAASEPVEEAWGRREGCARGWDGRGTAPGASLPARLPNGRMSSFDEWAIDRRQRSVEITGRPGTCARISRLSLIALTPSCAAAVMPLSRGWAAIAVDGPLGQV